MSVNTFRSAASALLLVLTILAMSTFANANPIQDANQLLYAGQASDALSVLLEASDDYKSDPLYHWYLATAYTLNGLFDESVHAAQSAMTLTDTPTATDYRRLGSVLLEAGYRPDAIGAFRIAYNMDPTNTWTLYYLALLLSQTNQPDESFAGLNAEDLWLEFEAASPTPSKMPTLAFYYLGTVYKERGDSDKAVFYYRLFFTKHEPETNEEGGFLLRAIAYLDAVGQTDD